MLLLARNEAYSLLTWGMVAPLTTSIRAIPTAVSPDPAADGVPQPCVVSLDNIQAIRKDWLDSLIVPLHPRRMAAIERAVHFALGLQT